MVLHLPCELKGNYMTPKYEVRVNLDDMVQGYVAAALWTSDDGEGGYLDTRYDFGDLLVSTQEQARRDCLKFLELADQIMNGRPAEADCVEWGRDFWFSRNGHGSGFFDCKLYCDQQTADCLQALARYTFGEVNVELTAHGNVAFS
jgi:hypothetical protein